jgi:hypothetical protein
VQVGDLVVVDPVRVGLWRRYYSGMLGLVTLVQGNRVVEVNFPEGDRLCFGLEELEVVSASR